MVWAESGQIGAFTFGANNPQLALYIDSSSTSPSRGQSHRINKDNDHYWYPMSTSNSRLFLSAIGGKTISTAGTYYIYVYGGSYNGGSFHFNYQGVTRGCSIIWKRLISSTFWIWIRLKSYWVVSASPEQQMGGSMSLEILTLSFFTNVMFDQRKKYPIILDY